jgi:type IX secretion system PorP/SprF family membrane protein
MRKWITIISCFVCGFFAHAQDLTFSQFYEQPLLRNPALSGVFNGDFRIAGAYRDQWSSFTTPFKTGALSIENKFFINSNNDALCLGVQMTMDAAGDIQQKRTQLLPALAYHKSLSDNKDEYLSIAVMGGPVFSQFDPTALKLGDQFRSGAFNSSNPTTQPLRANGYNYWDVATGICYSTTFNDNETRLYIGAAVSHFTNPVIRSVTGSTQSILSPKYTLNIGYNTPFGNGNRLIAFADYFAQNGHRQLLGGALVGWDVDRYHDADREGSVTLYFGSFMRLNDALIPVIKMDFNHISLGISYDVNISSLRTVSNWRGGLEITASYRNFYKYRSSSLDKLRCIRF